MIKKKKMEETNHFHILLVKIKLEPFRNFLHTVKYPKK